MASVRQTPAIAVDDDREGVIHAEELGKQDLPPTKKAPRAQMAKMRFYRTATGATSHRHQSSHELVPPWYPSLATMTKHRKTPRQRCSEANE